VFVSSFRITVFGTYQDASTIMYKTLGWKRSMISVFGEEATPKSKYSKIVWRVVLYAVRASSMKCRRSIISLTSVLTTRYYSAQSFKKLQYRPCHQPTTNQVNVFYFTFSKWIFFFDLPHPSGRTKPWGLEKWVTETEIKNVSGGGV
jgi:hypothetical protein